MGIFANLEKEFDYAIVEEFFSHYSFMLDALERLIIGLEHKEQYKSNINEIFRIFHNIKSATGYLKLEPINKLVTLGEEVLEECRHLDGRASDTLINWLLRLSDQLQRYKKDLENDSSELSQTDHNIIKVPTVYLQ
ncbi:MAG: Hpt domain-containing protein [Epsilonproteobacteria bacterium]|nr:Hpt domain-containing protein [Campylobacterota bacterium]